MKDFVGIVLIILAIVGVAALKTYVEMRHDDRIRKECCAQCPK